MAALPRLMWKASIRNTMKTTSIIRNILLTGIAALVVGAALPAQAYDHDKTGYFDEHHHHHPYVHHNGHRGYWDSSSGTRVFITI
jgi:hypothetical protein